MLGTNEDNGMSLLLLVATPTDLSYSVLDTIITRSTYSAPSRASGVSSLSCFLGESGG